LIKIEVNEMSDEEHPSKDDIEKLKREVADLKEKLNRLHEVIEGHRRVPKAHRIFIDVGERIRDYIEDVMEDVAEGIAGELEKSVFIGPHGIRVFKHRWKPRLERGELETKIDFSKVASVMSALGSEHRLKILRELMRGGKYVSELQEKLAEITASTLSSHLDILEKAGLVVQEKVRGRYLITIPGRMAYRMARKLAKICQEGVEIDID
jgi:DNA-binding transcriptional ArsR family regulator